jgi:hypothetical protein
MSRNLIPREFCFPVLKKKDWGIKTIVMICEQLVWLSEG